MGNKWGIPLSVEKLVQNRDKKCVYCNIEFDESTRKTKPSWEHIMNDIRINGPDNITLCCISCNSSKGAKDLDDWFNTDYCKRKNINRETVAEVVQAALVVNPKKPEN